MHQKLITAYNSIREKTDFQARLGLVLGSGLGAFADKFQHVATIDYSEIANFPISTVEGHKGRFLFVNINSVPTVIMQGRVHYYEGYTMSDVVMPIRLMGLLGASTLLLTNAAGGINEKYNAGDFMAIEDHISSFVPDPLVGKNLDELGTRFPDMTNIYDPKYTEYMALSAKNLEIKLHKGIYCQLSGPAFETAAEIRMLRALGADAVGMSTACEATAAKHMGMKVGGLSFIANKAAGMTGDSLTHEEVAKQGKENADKFEQLVIGFIEQLVSRGL